MFNVVSSGRCGRTFLSLYGFLRDVEDAVPYNLRFAISVGADTLRPLICIFDLCPFRDIIFVGRCRHRPLQFNETARKFDVCLRDVEDAVPYNLWLSSPITAEKLSASVNSLYTEAKRIYAIWSISFSFCRTSSPISTDGAVVLRAFA